MRIGPLRPAMAHSHFASGFARISLKRKELRIWRKAECGKGSQRSRRLGGKTGSTAEARRTQRMAAAERGPTEESYLAGRADVFRIGT